MISKKSLLVTTLLALTVSLSAIADKPIYKWKDSQGNIKYTQSKPPRGTEFETIYQRTSKPSEAQSDQQLNADESGSSLDDVIAKQNEQKDIVAKKNEEIARKNCTIAKNNLQALKSQNIVQVEEKGERRTLSDKERSDKLKEAQANVEKFCNK